MATWKGFTTASGECLQLHYFSLAVVMLVEADCQCSIMSTETEGDILKL